MKELILKLSESELIKIIIEDCISFNEVDYCCSELQAYFVKKSEEPLCIGENIASSFFISLIVNLKKTIDNKLQLHQSITRNLGFMENEYCHDLPQIKTEFLMIPSSSGESSYWIGSNYEIMKTYNTTKPISATWMYNDYAGNIIFEITPIYKWSFFPDDLQDPEFETYEEFMKDYKPLIHRVIPRDVAVQWLEQAMKIHRDFFSTEENYQNLCKMLKW